jgi:SAM-dependent methyltransferase
MAGRDYITEMNKYYSSCAPWHDEFMGYESNDEMEALLGPIIEWVEPFILYRDVLEIACGTGNWTQVLSKRADSVLATDVNITGIEIARTKPYARDNVTFKVADAYTLDCIDGRFTAAFAADWWSHIPLAAVPAFVASLAGKLESGSTVVLLDMLPREELNRMFSHYDDEGNRISRRLLPNGEVFHVVKNFPTEHDLLRAFEGKVSEIQYREHDALRRWVLMLTLS